MSPDSPILLLESDRHFAAALARELAADRWIVGLAHDRSQARAHAALEPPRLLLLGSLSPEGPVSVLEEIRGTVIGSGGWDRALPVLVLGSEPGGVQALRAFEAGADDFMSRPVNYLELRARLRALMRRAPQLRCAAFLSAGALRIDTEARRAAIDGQLLELSRLELDLLMCLAAEPDRVFTRDELLRSVWGFRAPGATRTVDSHASRLRGKLRALAPRPWIVAVRGVGYRLI